MKNTFHFNGQIDNVTYKTFFNGKLKKHTLDDLDINNTASAFIVTDGTNEYAISKWVSPKRTRSEPFARVYETLPKTKRITIIPIQKDEGIDGDRDEFNAITLAWMNLLGIYIILAYYDDAEKNKRYKNKITSQKLDNEFVKKKINEIILYQSDAHHWNNSLVENEFTNIMLKSYERYAKIHEKTGVIFRNPKSTEWYANWSFKDALMKSNERSLKAATRETNTVHVFENLISDYKGIVEIKNFYDGTYYLTCDEVFHNPVTGEYIIQESKNTTTGFLPSNGEIRDALFKMTLFSNIDTMKINGDVIDVKYSIRLTSKKINGSLHLPTANETINEFIENNSDHAKQNDLKKLLLLNKEATHNNYSIIIEKARIQEV